ncbi:class I SAM-dependent methyltransferase [Candidatus Saccharibacteria bacterium]|nr:MAG: class I SAM-dependent methyltransferase [Candidatus Saccharibacteria bacterium]
MSTSSEVLSPEHYYDAFEYSGRTMQTMHGALAKLTLPCDIRESLQAIPEANLLVLGSATARNISNVALIDKDIRPGQGHKDTVVIVDRNHYPMRKHREEWEWMRDVVRNEEQNRILPYPSFRFGQADMRQLPMRDGTFDIVASDYTLNFLDTYEDVQQTFSEVQRVLKPGGILLAAVLGHSEVDPGIPVESLANTTAEHSERGTGPVTTLVHRFPLQFYTAAASEAGLAMRAADQNGNSYLCAVLQNED